MINPWFALGLQTARLAWEAQTVAALRMMSLAAGGVPGESEARPLVAEKMDALAEAGAVAASIAIAGGSGQKVAKEAANVSKKRVGQNRQKVMASSKTISHAAERDAISNRSLDVD